MLSNQCQIHGVARLSEGNVTMGRRSPLGWARLWLKRRLSHQQKRALKKRISALTRLAPVPKSRSRETVAPAAAAAAPKLEAGDRVRVKSLEEIEATLGDWHELKGCAFMPEMRPYCGTVQRVFKPVKRFVDERDYQVKKCRDVYLLDGAICEGTADYGRCDRSCFYFWRSEWLEKCDPALDGAPEQPVRG